VLHCAMESCELCNILWCEPLQPLSSTFFLKPLVDNLQNPNSSPRTCLLSYSFLFSLVTLSYPIPSFLYALTYPYTLSLPSSPLILPLLPTLPFPSPLLSPLLVSSQCCEGGIISPASCVYITKWLSVPDDHSTNENYTW
jgi:hypothetical protein